MPTPWIIVIMLVLSACQQQQATSLKIKPGQRVPDLQVRTLDKKSLTFATNDNKVTVLNIWATWCAPCRHELPSLEKLAGQLDRNQFQVIGISVDEDDHVVREFLRDKKVGFSNYLDQRMSVSNQVLGVRVFPTTFIIGKRGELVSVFEGWRYWDTPESLAMVKAGLKTTP